MPPPPPPYHGSTLNGVKSPHNSSLTHISLAPAAPALTINAGAADRSTTPEGYAPSPPSRDGTVESPKNPNQLRGRGEETQGVAAQVAEGGPIEDPREDSPPHMQVPIAIAASYQPLYILLRNITPAHHTLSQMSYHHVIIN